MADPVPTQLMEFWWELQSISDGLSKEGFFWARWPICNFNWFIKLSEGNYKWVFMPPMELKNTILEDDFLYYMRRLMEK